MPSPDLIRIALVGHANSGKTTLFNTLTGLRQKVANYAGVTVEYKVGHFHTTRKRFQIIDLPGIYSLHPISPDESMACQLCDPQSIQGKTIDFILCIIDAVHFAFQLPLHLKIKALKRPIVILLNRVQEAKKKGIFINIALLRQTLKVPVFAIQATQFKSLSPLLEWLNQGVLFPMEKTIEKIENEDTFLATIVSSPKINTMSLDEKIDRWVLHPVIGPFILLNILFFMFQAIFSWTETLKNMIEKVITVTGIWITQPFPKDSSLYSLLNDGFFVGLGTVFSFLPQILFLFFFLLILEESGYLPRAAFLFDHLLFKVGLTGRAFIPLLSSFACTIPSIMATRSIQHSRDRLITILIAPLITCSARLPIYTLLIAAFIPSKTVSGLLNLQGIILFFLYFLGIGSALFVAWVLKRLQSNAEESVLLMELPSYQFPFSKNILLELLQKLKVFVTRIGTIILALIVLLWFVCRFPMPPSNATEPAIYYSLGGYIGRILATFFQFIGFNWQICIALIPGLAAREVSIAALGTIYAMSGSSEIIKEQLSTVIAQQWSLPTALSLLAWYVFAPQCISTLTVIRRETNSQRNMLVAASYLFGLAYLASFITYRIALLW